MGSRQLSLVSVSRSLGDGWCAFVRGAAHGGAWQLPGGSLGLGGEDFPDMNWGYIVGPNGVETALRRFVAELRERRLPGVLSAITPIAAEVEPVAVELGLRPHPPLPLMCVRAGDAHHVESDFAVERVTDLVGVREAADVLADAYDIPAAWCEAMLGPEFPDLAAADVFLARREGHAVAVAGTAAVGGSVGIYAVGARKAHRRRGAGSAAVSGAIDHHLRGGAHLICLLSAPDAEAFYADLGFTVVDHPVTWAVPGP